MENKKILMSKKDKEEMKEKIREIYKHNEEHKKEFEKILDILVNNCEKIIYICYSKYVTFQEGKEVGEQKSNYNYCKLGDELRDEETLIKPDCKIRIFERKNGKFYSLISGLEYIRDLTKDTKLVKIDFLKRNKNKN